MDKSHYLKARKKAQKTCLTQQLRGNSPYLTALEDIISFSDIISEFPLGLTEIPLDSIAGTRNSERTHAFASDFMPLLDENTEFAAKWISLYESHLTEGIREPVIAVEFMNRFYVVEGNKRVSVLKYAGAVTIQAQVTRLIPIRDDSSENRIYYEFMDFYRLSSVNYLTFSQEGCYHRLLEIMGKKEDEIWSDDDKLDFHSSFIHFQDIFEEYGGQKLSLTTGDAFLVYLEIYGYDSLPSKSYSELRAELKSIWEDFEIYPNKRQVELITEPAGVSNSANASFIQRLLPRIPSSLHIGFVYDKSLNESSWNYNHELGRHLLETTFPNQVTTASYSVSGLDTQQDLEILQNAVQNGCNVLFTTSPTLLHLSLQTALKYPDCRILNCSLNSCFGHLHTYYGRMYEAKFLTGILAGILSPSPAIGYMADYPIYGATANINAFALGVKAVNPRAKIYLEWSCIHGNPCLEHFLEKQVAFVSDQDLISCTTGSRQFGLYDIRGNSFHNIAFPLWDWGKFYVEIVKSMLNGTWKRYPDLSPDKSINYFWGLSSGIIDIICSRLVPSKTKQLMELVKNEIASGRFEPFSGEIRSQDQIIRNSENQTMTVSQIGSINWLADNVIGNFPALEEMTETARRLVEFQGIELYHER